MTPAVDVTVIVPAYNEVRRIAATIEEIRTYFRTAGRTCQIIVSADGTMARARRRRALMSATQPHRHRKRGTGREGPRHPRRGAARHGPHHRLRRRGSEDADQRIRQVRGRVRGGRRCGHRVARTSWVTHREPSALVPPDRDRAGSPCSCTRSSGSGQSRIRSADSSFSGPTSHARCSRSSASTATCSTSRSCYLAEQLRYRIAQVPVRWRDDGDSRLNLMAGNLKNVLDIFRIRFARPAGTPSAELAQSDRTES